MSATYYNARFAHVKLLTADKHAHMHIVVVAMITRGGVQHSAPHDTDTLITEPITLSSHAVAHV